jgi:peptidoglycan DL-endopeptidase CwlO
MPRRPVVAAILVGVIVAVTGSLAAADPEFPSESDIEDARGAEDEAEEAVEEVEARLEATEAERDELHVSVGLLVEAYHGARIALEEAEAAEAEALSEAEKATAEVNVARADLGRLAASTYRTGGQLVALSALLEAGEPDNLTELVELLNTVTRSQGEVYSRWMATAEEATLTATAATAAVADRKLAEEQVKGAFEDAEAAVARHEELVTALEAEREQLIEQLADARGTTVELERERQAGIEAEERAQREREAAEAEAEAEAAARAQATQRLTSTPTSKPSEPAPEPKPPPADTSAADKAIAYAYDQIGKPYQWGSSGPGSFDCSGLTMRAWEQGGVTLSHWSVAQARETTRVSYADLQPGDLIFWSNNGEPSGTYHVALYVGDRKMIHAPSSGKTVEVQDVFYWESPSFYGRI